jgi:hypothetical protein
LRTPFCAAAASRFISTPISMRDRIFCVAAMGVIDIAGRVGDVRQKG